MWISRTPRTLIAAARTASCNPALALGLDVNDDLAAVQHPFERPLDLIGGGVPLAHDGLGRDADHDLGEVAPARLAHAQLLQVDRRIELVDRLSHRLCGRARATVDEDVGVLEGESRRGDEDDRGDEESGDRVGLGIAGADEDEPDEHPGRAEEVADEVEGVRLQGGAAVAGPRRGRKTIVRPASIAITIRITTRAHQVASTSGGLELESRCVAV